jgi:hypothetical protein
MNSVLLGDIRILGGPGQSTSLTEDEPAALRHYSITPSEERP